MFNNKTERKKIIFVLLVFSLKTAAVKRLNLEDIQRLIKKSRESASLLDGKHIVLLVGITGSGKSTTIQFLSGAKMKTVKIKIAPDKFLDHIFVDGSPKNPALVNVISSPLSMSKTRFLVSVTVSLKDIFGDYKNGEIILCDTPGFGDTAGAEVDIANSIGVIEGIKRCKSVKILALSSYRSLGDRGEGIQTLASVLSKLIQGIKERLYGVCYAFTKCPEDMDIHALLLDIKNSKVENNPILQSDADFMAVLTDMINKTKDGVEKIDPIQSDPKVLITTLDNMKGISYPDEVFQPFVSESTRITIQQQLHQYTLSIKCSLSSKHIPLLRYDLCNLKTLSDLMNENSYKDTYKESIKFLRDSFQQYYCDLIERLRHLFSSQDELRQEDIEDYKTAFCYIEQIQVLREHFGTDLISVDLLFENIVTELNNKHPKLQDQQNFFHPTIAAYLNNYYLLQNSFKQLESSYGKICAEMYGNFDRTFLQPVTVLISTNNFKGVARILAQISESAPSFDHHFDRKIEKARHSITKSVLQHLKNVSEEGNEVLSRSQLALDDIKVLQKCVAVLRSAKETLVLQDEIFKIDKENDLKKIFDSFISHVIRHFDEINVRIKELLERNGEYAFDSVHALICQLEMVRSVPEIESKTAHAFYRIVDHIHGYMKKQQGDAERLLHNLDSQSEVINVRSLTRELLRLEKNAWIDRLYPGASDALMRNIREELTEHAKQREYRLIKLNFSLKYPQNIPLALQIIEKADSLIPLEHSVPVLREYRDRINQHVLDVVQKVFSDIKNSFNLSQRNVDDLRCEWSKLEQIKNEHDCLYPATSYLRTTGYSNLEKLNLAIEDVKWQQNVNLREAHRDEYEKELQLKDLESIVERYQSLETPKIVQTILASVFPTRVMNFFRPEDNTKEYLILKGYSNIEIVKELIKQIQIDHNETVVNSQRKLKDLEDTLIDLKQVRETYTSLINTEKSANVKEIDFFQQKGYSNYDLLECVIKEKQFLLDEYEKNGRMYYFTEPLDAAGVNNALIYISSFDKVTEDNLKKEVTDAYKSLANYIKEFGNFLDSEIERNFNCITQIGGIISPQYSDDLDRRLEELSCLETYTQVFECLGGAKRKDTWRKRFNNYYRRLRFKIEEHKTSGKKQELQQLLHIAQALSCIDHHCKAIFLENGFHILYAQNHIDQIRMSQEALKRAIDYISKGDYASVDLELCDLFENKTYFDKFKQSLENSLNRIMKNTRINARRLDDNIVGGSEFPEAFRKIDENMEKVYIVLSQHNFVQLLDAQTHQDLRHFENEICQILTQTVVRFLCFIETLINTNNIFEVETFMKDFNCAIDSLKNDYTLKSVDHKVQELKIRLATLPEDILQQYDFVDIKNYVNYPPRDLLEQLNRASSGGYIRYLQVSNLLTQRIRLNFSLAIKEARDNISLDRTIKIRTVRDAFCFLPDSLKATFKDDLDALNQWYKHENEISEFD